MACRTSVAVVDDDDDVVAIAVSAAATAEVASSDAERASCWCRGNATNRERREARSSAFAARTLRAYSASQFSSVIWARNKNCRRCAVWP